MSTHPSGLELDELVSGLREPGPLAGHLAECPRCRDRLVYRRAQQARFEADARARALEPRPTPRRARRRFSWRLLLVTPLLGAAVAALVVLRPHPDDLRSKGEARLELLDARGPVERTLLPGERVLVRIDPVGHRWLLLLGVDERGEVSLVWPSRGDRSAEVPPNGRLEQEFVATPGTMVLVGLLSHEPLAAADVEAAWAGSGALASPREWPVVAGESARAIARVEVGAP